MRHGDLEIARVIALARAARELDEDSISAEKPGSEHLSLLGERYRHRVRAFIEAILEYEDRITDFVNHWRRWRKQRLRRRLDPFAVAECDREPQPPEEESSYPLLEVINTATRQPINIVVWQVRAIYDAVVNEETVTRIEYANGDFVDAFESCTNVIMRFCEACEIAPFVAAENR